MQRPIGILPRLAAVSGALLLIPATTVQRMRAEAKNASLLTLALAAVLALLAADCTPSTSVVTSWQDRSYRSGSLKKPLVVAVANKRLVRIELEDELARGLRGIGVDAVPSHTMFFEKELTEATIKDRLPSTDRDSVMVTHLVDVKRETAVIPEQTYYVGPEDYPRLSQRWGTYYTHTYDVVTSPEYTYEAKRFVLQTNLYSAANEKLVWSAVTESAAVDSLDEAMGSFAGIIVKEVEKNRLF